MFAIREFQHSTAEQTLEGSQKPTAWYLTLPARAGARIIWEDVVERRPNLLFITTDQQRWDSLGLHGRPGYRSPNLDRLAAEGVCFDRAYCPAPVCTPARVSIITGQYPTRHGAYQIGMEPVPALEGPTLGTILSGHGYRTALIGKTHFVARLIEHQHVAGVANPDLDGPDPDEAFWRSFDGPYLGFQFVRHCQSHTADKPPNAHYRAWLQKQGLDLDHLHNRRGRSGNAVARVNPYGRWEIDEAHTQTAWIAEEATAWMERQQESGEPWFCWASFQDPHPPYVCPEPYYSQVDMTGVDLGGFREGEWDDKPAFYRRFAAGHYWGDETDTDFIDPDCPVKNIPANGRYGNVKDPARAIQAYIAMCNMVDVYVGKLLAALDRVGARENTLIIFTTDHGDTLGRHGLWGKGIAAYDDHQRIPAVASWPAAQKGPVGRTASAFNLVDVLPTFLDAAGAPTPPFVQGISQLPVIRGETAVLRDWALVDFLATVKLHQRTFVHGDWKLVVYRHADYGELYNLKDDPDQYENLFERPQAREVRERLLHRLARAQMEIAGTQPRRISHA